MPAKKFCSKCSTKKPLLAFHRDKSQNDGHRTWCKECVSAHQKAYTSANRAKLTDQHREYRRKNPEKLREISRRSYANHREDRNAYDRERWQIRRESYNEKRRNASPEEKAIRNERCRASYWQHLEKRKKYYNERGKRRKLEKPELVKEWRYNTHIKSSYGLSREDFERMVIEQDGKCAICNRPPRDKRKKLVIDHSHSTGAVRQLLCRHCNAGMGLLEDDPELLQAAINYLRKHST